MKIISSYGVELRKQNIPIRQTLEIYRSAVLNLGQFFPYRFIHFDQIADSRTVNLQCLADRNILFS